MGFVFQAASLAAGLFGGMLLFIEIGRQLGIRKKPAEGDIAATGIGVLEGSIFALLGLVIAFSFSGALTRFDWRRQLIVEEVNDIGTAYLRIDLLPAEDQPAIRSLFREYVKGRIAVYEKVPDMAAVDAEAARLAGIQQQIWTRSLNAAHKTATPSAGMLLMPALNAMFDILTSQMMASRLHPPAVVFGMLFILALISSMLVGYDIARVRDRHWIHLLGFTLAVAFSVYVILDLEYPRLGLIRINDFDKAMHDLLAQMK